MKLYESSDIPRHPGRILKEDYLDKYGIKQTNLVKVLNSTWVTVNSLVNEKIAIDMRMACKLGKFTGTSPLWWLACQNKYDLYQLASKDTDDLLKTERKLIMDLESVQSLQEYLNTEKKNG